MEFRKIRRKKKALPTRLTWRLTGITGSSITPVGARVTVFAGLMALLLTRLRGSENSQLPCGLEGLLNDTFGYYLLLGTFGLAVVASFALVATIGGFANPSLLAAPGPRTGTPLLVGARRDREGKGELLPI